MKRFQSFKYELRPNSAQQRLMRRIAGSCRFVFNKALALQNERFLRRAKKLNYPQLCRLLTNWRNSPETGWLADAPVHPLQQSLLDLERAYANFFAKRAALPRFKKKSRGESFRYPAPTQIKLDQINSRVLLPKLGWLRFRKSREVAGILRNVTVSQSGDKWFVSIETLQDAPHPEHPSDFVVGVDVGIARFATLSDGTTFAPVNSFKQYHQRLARASRAMSRKTKFGKNWRKAKARVQKIHRKISNVRRDYLHKITTQISKNHAIVCIEDLQVKNMTKSAAGTVAQPGYNVKVKAALNRSICDQSWGEFRRQLEYKQSRRGGLVLAVPSRNTSRTCPACRHVSADNRRTRALFACVECGFEGDADLVGAINILERGMMWIEGQDSVDASTPLTKRAQIACEVNGAMRPSAAGTHRSDYAQYSSSVTQ